MALSSPTAPLCRFIYLSIYLSLQGAEAAAGLRIAELAVEEGESGFSILKILRVSNAAPRFNCCSPPLLPFAAPLLQHLSLSPSCLSSASHATLD